MNEIEKISVIVPSLNPSETILGVVSGLVDAGFGDVIVVNDGSDEAHLEIFERVAAFPQCTVLTHPRNQGKGAALKTAFSFFLRERAGKSGVVTMDGDGQHLSGDAVKCAEAVLQAGGSVVLGVRDFHHADVPRRNSIGNRFTAFALRLLFGIKVRDTQTGLRGIPAKHVPMMLDIPGNRFEYETNMLLEAERLHIPFYEVEIETVYEEGSNERSHFRPLVDSLRIFSQLSKYAVSSVLSFLIDIGIFWLTIRAFGPTLGLLSIPVCTAIARVFSSFINFNLNKLFVFRRRKSYGSHLWRYYALAVVQMLASAGLLWVLAYIFVGSQAAGLLTALKMLVDMALFCGSYYIQRIWVFKSRSL